jgi:CRISPR-associated endoribonuclease Cas6
MEKMMRMKMVFKLERPELDIQYRRAFLSLLKKSFKQASEAVYQKLYENGTAMKPFTFGVFLPQPEFRENMVVLRSREITLNFSTSETELGIYFYNSLVRNRFIPFPLANGNSLSLQRVHLQREHPIRSSGMVFKTLTPFLVRVHQKGPGDDRYLTKEDEDFVSQLQWGIQRMTEVLMGQKETVTVEPVKFGKEILIMHYGQYVTGNKGIIKLTGKPGVLDFIYKVGLGSRRSEGFGLLEVVG